MMRTSFTVMTLGTALLVAACRSRIPEQPIGRVVPAPVVVATPAGGGPWLYRPATQRRAVTLNQQATVEIRQDALVRTDTVSLQTEVAYTVFAGTHRISGIISAYRVQSGSAAAGTPPGLVVPFPFAGDFPSRGRQLELTQPASRTACASPAFGAAQSLRDLWFQPPDTLRIGTLWSDTSTYVVCRDGIPLQASNARTFRVTAAADSGGRQVLTINRRARGTIRGDGAQSGEPLTILGQLSGELTYHLAPATGDMLSVTGTSLLEFTLTSRLRTQQVRQQSRITAAPTLSKK